MKTIKFTLLGLLSLFISVLLLRYAVISLSYITTDFTTINSKDILNFGLTFAIQAIVLVAIALFALTVMVSCFSLTRKYYIKGSIDRRNAELLKHIEDEKYQELCDKLRQADSIEEREKYITDYLNPVKTESKSVVQTEKAMENWGKIMKEFNKPSVQIDNINSVSIENMNAMPDLVFDKKNKE